MKKFLINTFFGFFFIALMLSLIGLTNTIVAQKINVLTIISTVGVICFSGILYALLGYDNDFFHQVADGLIIGILTLLFMGSLMEAMWTFFSAEYIKMAISLIILDLSIAGFITWEQSAQK